MARPYAKLTAKAENCIRMEARGEDHAYILKEIFNLDADCDPKEKARAEQQMWRWRHHPQADAIWEEEIRARVKRFAPRAIGRIEKQIADANGWLANKAANDIMNLAKSVGVFGEEEKGLTVKIEGNIPDIGAPDDDG